MADAFSQSVKLSPLSDPMALGKLVRNARRNNSLTQTQLAGLAGTGLRFLSELERGKPNVALNKTLAVLAVLGLRIYIDAEPQA
ncbi:MAG: helix-turn-helix transcriptional regulator [Proteobacteria bacterium]|nr:helix-turn-helix transcriptional regulator [Pseudomonadota bacterium]